MFKKYIIIKHVKNLKNIKDSNSFINMVIFHSVEYIYVYLYIFF